MKNEQRAEERTRLVNGRTGAVLAERLDTAGDSATRRKGWLGREEVPEGEGLWIVPCEAVHCFFMKFPIDVLFLNKAKRVVKVRPAVKPWRIAACLRAESVVELPAGVAEATGTVAGDELRMERY
jgi:uncharacterized membrane protein (UPF0127 family)